ncbi:MAG TPA: hypothetical protein VFV38_28700 [Ktedonobacteraceae bacterium]|nr:hypothetical protein [Ktedonobacteraceae bacterium]
MFGNHHKVMNRIASLSVFLLVVLIFSLFFRSLRAAPVTIVKSPPTATPSAASVARATPPPNCLVASSPGWKCLNCNGYLFPVASLAETPQISIQGEKGIFIAVEALGRDKPEAACLRFPIGLYGGGNVVQADYNNRMVIMKPAILAVATDQVVTGTVYGATVTQITKEEICASADADVDMDVDVYVGWWVIGHQDVRQWCQNPNF